ncbi:hypothetical protein [Rufibacter sp. LB8]|uniref:hypothetical protein n=1 Tax=Rufibacter sp. LB8 TaxID=2777781 RepID=UPI00178C39AF|nr:hypothetical protein [Rufibacter sp. LB8]
MKFKQMSLFKTLHLILCVGIACVFSSCLVSNHLFIPLDAKSKSEDVIKGKGYTLECYAPYYRNDFLEVNIRQADKDTLDRFKLSNLTISWKKNEDSVTLHPEKIKQTLHYSYDFTEPNIKKIKNLTIRVEGYLVKGRDSVVINQTYHLKKERDYFFTIH